MIFDVLLALTFIVRTMLLIVTIIDLRAKRQNQETEKLQNAKQFLSIIFNFLMGVILLYLFNIFTTNTIQITDREKIFLFLFGVLSIITSIQNF